MFCAAFDRNRLQRSPGHGLPVHLPLFHLHLSPPLYRVIKKNREKKAKEKQEKKTPQPLPVALQQGAGVVLPKAPAPVPDRKHLHNYRVVQRNLAYVIGLPGKHPVFVGRGVPIGVCALRLRE